MFGLLLEGLNEILSRPMALVKIFWLTVVLYTASLASLLFGFVSEREVIVVLLVLLILVASPGAVGWHRHILADEQLRWLPRPPDLKSLIYAAKLGFVSIFVGMSQKVASSIAQDILLPIYGLATGGVLPEDPANVTLALNVTEICIRILAFLLIAGWMLSLPEGTLEPSMRGFRKKWPIGGKVDFFGALAVVYFAPVLVSELAAWPFPDQFIWRGVIGTGLGLIATVLGLSLLTVAYRRNVQRS
jgi:hypothetical protein